MKCNDGIFPFVVDEYVSPSVTLNSDLSSGTLSTYESIEVRLIEV